MEHDGESVCGASATTTACQRASLLLVLIFSLGTNNLLPVDATNQSPRVMACGRILPSYPCGVVVFIRPAPESNDDERQQRWESMDPSTIHVHPLHCIHELEDERFPPALVSLLDRSSTPCLTPCAVPTAHARRRRTATPAVLELRMDSTHRCHFKRKTFVFKHFCN
jgi:hypothetical protein